VTSFECQLLNEAKKTNKFLHILTVCMGTLLVVCDPSSDVKTRGEGLKLASKALTKLQENLP
jgi:hypothetical protein